MKANFVALLYSAAVILEVNVLLMTGNGAVLAGAVSLCNSTSDTCLQHYTAACKYLLVNSAAIYIQYR